jgi:outer membrane protein OmpA-like peptidoglycan-associated protein
MNFKNILNVIAISILFMSLAFCSSNEKKDPAPEETPVTEDTGADLKKDRSLELNLLEEINITLKEYRYPDGVRRRGFSYKKADVTREDFNLWAKENINFIKEAMDKLPADYSLQIKGHADSTGPEEAEGSKKGNIYYSQIRAEAVKEALVQQGLDASRIKTKAVGSSEPVGGYDEEDEVNRRTTFQVVIDENSDTVVE